MIDTHCHLNFPPFLANFDKIIQESKKAGLTGIVIASSNLQDSKISVELAKKYPDFLSVSVGVHPQNTDSENPDSISSQLVKLDQLAQSENVVAIGETGLDYSESKTAGQEELFLGQIKLVQKYNLALIVHARKTNDEIIEILSSSERSLLAVPMHIGTISKERPYEACGVFHCYSGGKKRIQRILDLPGTWYFGFDGNLTYEEGLQQVIKLIPADRIVIETDSPYLAPLPYRGQENSPANLPLIQQKINEIFGKDLTSVIDANSRRLFKI